MKRIQGGAGGVVVSKAALFVILSAGLGLAGPPQAVPQLALRQAAQNGEAALKAGHFEEAIPYLQKALTLSPRTAELHADLALAYYSTHRSQEAVHEAQTALGLNGRLTKVRVILGLSLAESGHCEEALPVLDKSYGLATDRGTKREIGTSGVRCAMVERKSRPATMWVERLKQDFPDDPDVLYLATHVFSELSTEASERLLSVAPASIPAHLLNAEVLEMQGQTADAIQEYRRVISMNPRQPDAHYQIGRLLLRESSDAAARDEARRAFEEELKIDPGNAAAEYQLGDLARQARQWNEAIQHFNRARQLAPQSPEVLLGLAGTYIAEGQFEEARPPLEEAVKVDPDSPEAHYMLASVYRRLGREQDATQELRLYDLAYSKASQTKMRIRKGMSAGPAAKSEGPTPPAPDKP